MVIRRLRVALMCALLAGCATQSISPQPSPGPDLAVITPYPQPSASTPLALEVAQPLALPSGAVEGCDQALLGPVRIVLTGTVVLFVSMDTGMPVGLIWPRGFAAWLVNGKAEIVAPDGAVIGLSGDVLSGLGGGGSGTAFAVCSIGKRNYP